MAREKSFKKIIKDDLKKAGRKELANKITFCRYKTFSMGNSLNITVTGATDEERAFFTAFIEPYEYGTFDGMTDCQGIKNRDAKVERQAKYVHVRYDRSEEQREEIKNEQEQAVEVCPDCKSKCEGHDAVTVRECGRCKSCMDAELNSQQEEQGKCLDCGVTTKDGGNLCQVCAPPQGYTVGQLIELLKKEDPNSTLIFAMSVDGVGQMDEVASVDHNGPSVQLSGLTLGGRD